MPDATAIATPAEVNTPSPRRLHIGGEQVRDGWEIVNVQAGPHVDHLGDVLEVAKRFDDASVDELYASHILEHLGYDKALPETLKELARILKPDGKFYIAVPDLMALSKLFAHPQLDVKGRMHVMRIMFGGRTDPYDVHVAGFDQEILGAFLGQAGFKHMQRVQDFGLFADASRVVVAGVPISLNVVANK